MSETNIENGEFTPEPEAEDTGAYICLVLVAFIGYGFIVWMGW